MTGPDPSLGEEHLVKEVYGRRWKARQKRALARNRLVSSLQSWKTFEKKMPS